MSKSTTLVILRHVIIFGTLIADLFYGLLYLDIQLFILIHHFRLMAGEINYYYYPFYYYRFLQIFLINCRNSILINKKLFVKLVFCA